MSASPNASRSRPPSSQCLPVKLGLLGLELMKRLEPRAVANSVEDARPLGVAKCRAATESELTESSGEFPDVVKSVGEAWPGVPKISAVTVATAVAPTVPKSCGRG